jgi:hypothetical protein
MLDLKKHYEKLMDIFFHYFYAKKNLYFFGGFSLWDCAVLWADWPDPEKENVCQFEKENFDSLERKF